MHLINLSTIRQPNQTETQHFFLIDKYSIFCDLLHKLRTMGCTLSKVSKPRIQRQTSYLAKPDLTKNTKIFKHGSLCGAVCEMKGWREYMEDYHAVLNDPEGKSPLLLGIFDGHNGGEVAAYCKNHILTEIQKHSAFKEQLAEEHRKGKERRRQGRNSRTSEKNPPPEAANPEDCGKDTPTAEGMARRCTSHTFEESQSNNKSPTGFQKAAEQVFLETDRKLRKAIKQDAGSTALVVAITSEQLQCASVGDSRCILSRSGRQLPLSVDHKPSRKAERRRILNAGGFVDDSDPDTCRVGCPSVLMSMAMSRSIGDFDFKFQAQLPPDKQIVTCIPDVVSRERKEADTFLVLASDGIWDVFSNIEMILTLDELVSQGINDVVRLGETLLEKAYWRGSTDNMTIILVDLRSQEMKENSNKNLAAKTVETSVSM